MPNIGSKCLVNVWENFGAVGETISDLFHFVTGFQEQLNLFKIEVSRGELHKLPCCAEIETK